MRYFSGKYVHGLRLLCFVVVRYWMTYPYPSQSCDWPNTTEANLMNIHYDVIKWKHLPRYWLCEGNPPVTFEEIYSTRNWQKDAQFLLYILMWVVGKINLYRETHINWYRHKEDVCNAVMVWLNTFFIFKEHAYVANWFSYERYSRQLNETFQSQGALTFYLMWARTNGSINNWVVVDSRRHCAHVTSL